MLRSLVVLLALTITSVNKSSQATPVTDSDKLRAFDTVVIRQNKSGDLNYGFQFPPNGLRLTNCPIKTFIVFAFGVKSPDFIKGLPAWAETARFDVSAKLDDDSFSVLQKLPRAEATEARMRMFQQVLIDRFHLKTRHELAEMPAYALVVDKSGLKIKEADPMKITIRVMDTIQAAHPPVTGSLQVRRYPLTIWLARSPG